MFLTMCMINLSMTFMFMFINHPMSMGMILMIQTILISMITGFFSLSMWFSFILFLIMIGGMLILFMYMTSIASNEKFSFSLNMFILFLIFFFITFFLLLNLDMSMINLLFKTTNSMEMINKMISFKNENMYSLNSLYNKPLYMITIMLINYLLLTLIATVKITKFNYGPLRQKF
uniref:NADH-ubiquinone oxidoreductase chain 6 n=1 Tax=Deronectes angusi TaxID=156922 RepID=A0A894K7K3_9DYTI|nr:NADH dehydrogenase subunit 6 [Deronectes angusi]